MAVVRGGIYSVLRRAGSDPVRLAGYRALTMSGADSVSVQSFALADGRWEAQPYNQLVYSPTSNSWVSDDRTQKVSVGPEGSRGWPTVKSEAAYGTTYTTYSSLDLAGRPLADGLETGWSESAALPDSATAAVYSPGARSYVETVTAVDPTYLVNRIRNPDRNTEDVMRVLTCASPDVTQPCDTPATSLDDVTKGHGRYTNSTRTGSLQFRTKGDAYFTGEGLPIYELLDVTVVTDDGPPRITFSTPDPAVAGKFEKVFRTSIENFALYAYEGQVVVGAVQPAGTTRTDVAGYNRVAADDLLTHWTPALPPVNP